MVERAYAYDALNRLVDLEAYDATGSEPIYSVAYGYDLAGERRSATETTTGHGTRHLTWSYDGLYRLTGESWTGTAADGTTPLPAYAATYVYGAAGNRLTSDVAQDGTAVHTEYRYGQPTQYSSYPDPNQLTQAFTDDGRNTLYQYDADGNLVEQDDTVGSTTTVTYYHFDAAGRLASADHGGDAIFSAAYDARSRRL